MLTKLSFKLMYIGLFAFIFVFGSTLVRPVSKVSAQDEGSSIRESIQGRLNSINSTRENRLNNLSLNKEEVVSPTPTLTVREEMISNFINIRDKSDSDSRFGLRSLFSEFTSFIPMIEYGESVILNEPTRSTVIAIAKYVEINAPIGRDLFVIAFQLNINEVVVGRVNAFASRVSMTVPNTLELHTPFSLGKIIWEEFLKPANNDQEITSDEGSLEVQDASSSAQDKSDNLIEASASSNLNTITPTIIQENSLGLEEQSKELVPTPVDRGSSQDSNAEQQSSSIFKTNLTNSFMLKNLFSKFSLVNQVHAQEIEGMQESEITDGLVVGVVEDDISEGNQMVGIDWQPVVRFFWKLSTLVITILGMSIIIPRLMKNATSTLLANPITHVAWGFVGLVILPVLSIMLLFTGLGWSISIVITLLYGVGLILASPIVAMAIGELIVTRLINQVNTRKWQKSLLFKSLVGSIVVVLLSQLPIIGWWLGFLITLAGLGSGMMLIQSGKTNISSSKLAK